MISVETYRDQGLTHPDVIVRASSQHEVASRRACTPDATRKIIEAIETYGLAEALPEQIFAPYQHDAETFSWLVSQFEKLPAPSDKIERIFADRWLYWATFCSPELAAEYVEKIAETKFGKAVAKYSSKINDIRFNARLAGKDKQQCLEQLEEWLDEIHDLGMDLAFDLIELDAMSRQIAHLGGASSELLNQWLELRPDFDGFEPSLEELQVELALRLLEHDTKTPVKLESLLYWVGDSNLSSPAYPALRNRVDEQLAEQLIDNFANYPKNIRKELSSILCASRSPGLVDKVWKIYQEENDFEVLGNLTDLLVAYGGEKFEGAALEMLDLDGVEYVDDLIFRIYTNRILSGEKFPEKAEWNGRLSAFLTSDHIHEGLSYEMDPDVDEDIKDAGII